MLSPHPFPAMPGCMASDSMDKTDVARLRARVDLVVRTRSLLEGRHDLRTHESGISRSWYLNGDASTGYALIDVSVHRDRMRLSHPAQSGHRAFVVEIMTPKTDLRGVYAGADADTPLRTIIETVRLVMDLPFEGVSTHVAPVREAARRAADVVGALRAVNGVRSPTTVFYHPKTPHAPAKLRQETEGSCEAALEAGVQKRLLANDPVCVALSES